MGGQLGSGAGDTPAKRSLPRQRAQDVEPESAPALEDHVPKPRAEIAFPYIRRRLYGSGS